MSALPKKDGKPRRVIDLRNLNKHTIRQTHHTDSPYTAASRIKPGTIRTTTDAWNGFHSVPLAKEDRHMTTFISPWGRYRYCVTPQGQAISTDAFTHRYDIVTCEVPDHVRIVDDSCLWNENITDHVKQVCEYLHLTGSNGIIQNPDKFVFGRRSLENVGFQLTPD